MASIAVMAKPKPASNCSARPSNAVAPRSTGCAAVRVIAHGVCQHAVEIETGPPATEKLAGSGLRRCGVEVAAARCSSEGGDAMSRASIGMVIDKLLIDENLHPICARPVGDGRRAVSASFDLTRDDRSLVSDRCWCVVPEKCRDRRPSTEDRASRENARTVCHDTPRATDDEC